MRVTDTLEGKIQIGDIRLCTYNFDNRVADQEVEIIARHPDTSREYWIVQNIQTGYVIEYGLGISWLDKLIQRAEYEVCE